MTILYTLIAVLGWGTWIAPSQNVKTEGTDGQFIEPTVFTEAEPDLGIAKDEIFEPVLSIIKFNTADEAIKIANGTNYGLSAGARTKDLDTAMTMSRRMEAGTVWINNWTSGYSEIPFGGMKQSDPGRELGPHSMDEFMEIRSVLIKTGTKPGNWAR